MYHYKNQQGLTLIEVLIALAIVGIALTAALTATSQNIRASTYLQNKTIAAWVGLQVMNEARVGILVLPRGEGKLNGKTEMLSQRWFWDAYQEETPNSRIQKIVVTVSAREDIEAAPLIHLESYVYHET